MNPLLYKDYTVKAKLRNKEKVEALLTSLRATRVGLDVQTDTYFETAKGKLKLRQGVIENLITHYERIREDGLERTIVYRYDVNPTDSDIALLMSEQAVIGVVRKERIIYLLAACKIHIDHFDGHSFLEIEAIDREGKFTMGELKRQCWKLKEKLEIKDHDLMPTGYF